MQSKAKTVKQYLAELPPDRRAAISAIRDVILKNLDEGYEEGINYGAIGYSVPHRVYPPGYHCDPKLPLPFAGLGSQKNYLSMGFMPMYSDPAEMKWFVDAWKRSGKKLDMGKVCIRFKKLEDVPLDVVGEAVRRVPAAKWIQIYEETRAAAAAKKATTGRAKTKRRAPARKPARRR
jgi:uncharacterized protein YdhG (YjbR/CyaY superfamily)